MDKSIIQLITLGMLLACYSRIQADTTDNLELLLLTISTDESDGYIRFMGAANHLDLNVVVLGMSGDCSNDKGVECSASSDDRMFDSIKKALKKYKNNENMVVMFTKNENTILVEGKEKILQTFKSMNARIVFSAESTSPEDNKGAKDQKLRIRIGDNYVSAGGMIGYAKEMWTIAKEWQDSEADDEHEYLTMLYVDSKSKKKLNATLDTERQIFHNLNTIEEEDHTEIAGNFTNIFVAYKNETFPMVVRGSGHAKAHINHLGNYIPNGWNPEDGCTTCQQHLLVVDYSSKETTPHILIAIFIVQGTPFIEDFFQRIVDLDYDKSRITLYVQNTDIDEQRWVARFLLKHRHLYKDVVAMQHNENQNEWTQRNLAAEYCLEIKCDYYFNVDSLVQLTDPSTIKFLIKKDRQIIAPFVRKYKKYWTNFWGAYSGNGYYKKSNDYYPIVEGEQRGIWNVPHINSVYLIQASTIKNILQKTPRLYGDFTMLDEDDKPFDPTMCICQIFREQNVFMYVTNEEDFGRIMNEREPGINVKTNKDEKKKDSDDVDDDNDDENDDDEDDDDDDDNDDESEGGDDDNDEEKDDGDDDNNDDKKDDDDENYKKITYRLYPDVWEIQRNRLDWEHRFLHPDFYKVIDPDTEVDEPCPDVFVFPLLSEVLADQLIEIAEDANIWSTGSNEDPRVSGGYENVPTIDVRMEQIGLKKEWLYFMRKYPRKVVKKVYEGYGTDAESNTMFIVRYKPTEQPLLKPHHDHATWTVNIALNTQKKDYEGGGARFIRYNCSVVDLPKGWAILHPGRLTHYHEGLPTTKGTRYILVSFMDP